MYSVSTVYIKVNFNNTTNVRISNFLNLWLYVLNNHVLHLTVRRSKSPEKSSTQAWAVASGPGKHYCHNMSALAHEFQ